MRGLRLMPRWSTCAGLAAVAASALTVQSAWSASRPACTSQNATPGPRRCRSGGATRRLRRGDGGGLGLVGGEHGELPDRVAGGGWQLQRGQGPRRRGRRRAAPGPGRNASIRGPRHQEHAGAPRRSEGQERATATPRPGQLLRGAREQVPRPLQRPYRLPQLSRATLHFRPPSGVLGQPSVGRCLSGAAGGRVPMTAPAWARAAGSRRDLIRLATVVAARTTAMTASDTAVVISGTRGSSP